MNWISWMGCGLALVGFLGPYVLIYRLSSVVESLCRIVVHLRDRVERADDRVEAVNRRVDSVREDLGALNERVVGLLGREASAAADREVTP